MPAMNALERATELMGRMTLIEKTRQVTGIMLAAVATPEGMAQHMGEGIGHISAATLGAQEPKDFAAINNGVQHFLVENTRLGIPALLHGEALNGFVAAGYTTFPTAIGLAATWHPEVVEEMTSLIRRQMRSVGFAQALSPVLDIARDARWGRVHETYGEDVLLASAFGVAFVRGIQGSDLTHGVLATAKHFLGYAAAQGALNTSGALVNDRELYDVYATPFEAAIKLADLRSIMNSYADVDGIPAGASRAVLTELLRDRMGFTGSVISDYGTVEQLALSRKVAATPGEAGALAITAGLDVELPSAFGYGDAMVAEVESGRLAEDVLNTAVVRVLADKFRTGLFENPYVDDDPIVINDLAKEGGELSARIARETVTLIKNDGVLPLSDATRKIAVVGPHGEAALANFAGYTEIAHLDMLRGIGNGEGRMAGFGELSKYIPEEARAMMAAIDTEAISRHEYGAVSLTDALRERLPRTEIVAARGTGYVDFQPTDIPAAIEAARDADVVVLAIGGHATAAGYDITEGEGADTTEVDLPSVQLDLVQQIAALGKPTVAVVYMGRPYGLSAVDAAVSAVATGFYSGSHAARAMVSALLGDHNPAGKLPYTLPRSTGQVPIFHALRNGSGYRRDQADTLFGYVNESATPLYPFGHGLSYTTFEYGELALAAIDVPIDGAVTITVPVTNTGDRDGVEVVQVYFSDTATGVSRPERTLAAFARVELAAGETADVEFVVQVSQLGYTAVDKRFVIEPGPIGVLVGSSSEDIRARSQFVVVGETRDLEGRRSYLPEVTVRRDVLR